MSAPEAPERSDAEKFHPGYGKGGVPWYLLMFYLAFLSFFTWYSLEFQLPDFMDKQESAKEAANEEG